MNWEVFITCAITGAGDTTGKSDQVPVAPKEIADSAIAAAKAGAAVAHIHVRDPASGHFEYFPSPSCSNGCRSRACRRRRSACI